MECADLPGSRVGRQCNFGLLDQNAHSEPTDNLFILFPTLVN
jgi:hypothetical protein